MEMIDINSPKGVQVQVSADGKRLWVNIDGKCALRCSQIAVLEVEDGRNTPQLPRLPAGCPLDNYGGVDRNNETCICEEGWGHNADTWERFQTARKV